MKNVFVIRRPFIGLDENKKSFKYIAEDIAHSPDKWPTFRSLKKNSWIEQEELSEKEIADRIERQVERNKPKTSPKPANDNPEFTIICEKCDGRFKNKRALGSHIQHCKA